MSSEDPQPSQSKCLKSKQINQTGGYTTYTYRGDLLITEESKATSGAIFFRTEYEYNGTKLTKFSQFDNQTGNNTLVYQVIYDYNGNNLVKKQTFSYDRTTKKLTGQGTTVFEFDNNGNKIKETLTRQYTNSNGSISTFETMYVYEYNGKILTKQTYFPKTKQLISLLSQVIVLLNMMQVTMLYKKNHIIVQGFFIQLLKILITVPTRY